MSKHSLKIIHYQKDDSAEYVAGMVEHAINLGNAANILLVHSTTDVTIVTDQDISRMDDKGKTLQYITLILRDVK